MLTAENEKGDNDAQLGSVCAGGLIENLGRVHGEKASMGFVILQAKALFALENRATVLASNSPCCKQLVQLAYCDASSF